MAEYLGADRVFRGTAFQRAVIELETYGKRPDEITPLEVINWALDVGQWERCGVPGQQFKVWVGPAEPEPKPGGPLAYFVDDDLAVRHMRRQYESWYEQRTFFVKAIETIRGVKVEGCNHDGEEKKDEP